MSGFWSNPMKKCLTVIGNSFSDGFLIIFTRNCLRAERYIFVMDVSVIAIPNAIIHF